jgi:quercetin dioxygenase-like cupin family protein
MTQHLLAKPGDSVHWLHSTYTALLTPAQSDGALGIFECLSAPEFGPPRHVHREEDETFYILSGEVVFWLEGETMTKTAGDVVFIPRGKEHTYHVVGPDPARLLVMMTPGGFESFFFAVAAAGHEVPRDMEPMARLAADFNLEFTGPPLKA